MKRLCIVVHDLAAKEDLKIAEHVRHQESKEDQTGDRHDGFLADRGIVEPPNRNRTHKLPLSPLCKRNIVSKKELAQSGLIETALEISKRRRIEELPREPSLIQQ